ncbi:hypothetical protein GALL_496040 [mine drainage metagenome]|uniref:Uncharacterized protein n=1 Tax=mine drainage metagenome TaxID=410659 RepID=A0A1J5PLX8_9ZZZZ
MKHVKVDTVPLPVLAGLTARGRPQRLQSVVIPDRTEQLRLRLHQQHRWRTTGVVGVTVTEQQRVKPHTQRVQQRHQHPVTGIAVAAKARTRVVQQCVLCGSHQHRAALSDVCRQQFKLARRGQR